MVLQCLRHMVAEDFFGLAVPEGDFEEREEPAAAQGARPASEDVEEGEVDEDALAWAPAAAGFAGQQESGGAEEAVETEERATTEGLEEGEREEAEAEHASRSPPTGGQLADGAADGLVGERQADEETASAVGRGGSCGEAEE